MDTITPAAGSSPAPTPETPAAASAPAAPTAATPVAPAAPAPAAAAPAPSARDIANVLTSAERKLVSTGQKSLKDVLAARPVKPAALVTTTAPAIPEDAPAEPAANATETEATHTAEPTPEIPAAQSDDMPDRFRFKDPADQAIALIAKSKGVNLIEATRIYQAVNPAQTPEAESPEVERPDPDLQGYDKALADLDAKVAKLSEDRDKAREDVDMKKADSLSDEIAEAKADLKILRNERQGYVRNREQAATQTVQQQVTASKERAVAEYAELATEGTLHRDALDAFVQRAIADPQRAALFDDPTWPEKLTAEFAAKHGLKKKGAAAPAAAPAAAATPAARPATPTPAPTPALRPKVQQVPGAKLNTGADGQQPSAPAATVDDVRAALPRMTPAQRKQVLFGR